MAVEAGAGPGGPWAYGGPPWGPGGRPPWRRNRWRGFGCLFALVFLVVLISFVTVGVTILSSVLGAVGPVPVVIVGILVVAMLAGLAGGLRRSARTLDALVDATRRVEDGDYSVRVDVPERGLRSGPPARARLRHDGRAARGR